jgi:hypothetical protein
MTRDALTTAAARALHIAARGTTAQIDAYEDDHGASLSSMLDYLAAEAEDQGDTALAARLDRAFARLTG